MSGPNERITTAISSKELERRWTAARKEMRERGVDALVMQNNSDWLGGYVKWFTDIPATNAYPKTVVFHADDPMTMIEMGGFNTVRNLKGADPVHRGVGELIGSPSFFAVNYTDNFHADCILAGLKTRGYKTIGLVGPGSMPHAFVTRLKEGLNGTKFVDATDFIDRLKAIKSEEEIGLIKRCVNKCVEIGFLETELRHNKNGKPTVHYRVNTEKFTESILKFLSFHYENFENENLNFSECHNEKFENALIRNTETTTNTTSETTAKKSSSAGSPLGPEQKLTETKDDDDDDEMLVIYKAWTDAMETKLTPHIKKNLKALRGEFGARAVIGGILTSAEAGGRSFRYVERTIRNAAQPPPASTEPRKVYNSQAYADLMATGHYAPAAQEPSP